MILCVACDSASSSTLLLQSSVLLCIVSSARLRMARLWLLLFAFSLVLLRPVLGQDGCQRRRCGGTGSATHGGTDGRTKEGERGRRGSGERER